MSDNKIHPQIPEEAEPVFGLSFEYDDIEKKDTIGERSGANVYRGLLTVDGTSHEIALKEPQFEGTIQKDIFEKFEQEAETWSNLDNHENIVSVYGYDTNPLPWIALEYMDGGTLANHVDKIDTSGALWMAGRIAEGIHYAHRHGVAHLHLSPYNILLRETTEGKWNYPKVSDWGIAQLQDGHTGSEERLISTYAAPEQVDPEEYGASNDITDIYQFGAIVYEPFPGRPPFTGSPTEVMQSILQEAPPAPTEINPDLPPQIDEILLKALKKEKSERYESMVLFQHELDKLFEDDTDGNFVLSESVSSAKQSETSASESSPNAASETTTEETGEDRTDSNSLLLSRRGAIGVLGAGIVGGGAYAMTQRNPEDCPTEGGDGSGECPPPEPEGSDIAKWEELLFEGFATGDKFIAQRPTASGGAITYVTPTGERPYTTQSIGAGYTLQLRQGQAVAQTSDLVFGAGSATGPDVNHARVVAYGQGSEVGTRQWTHETPGNRRTFIQHVAADQTRVFYTAEGDRAPTLRALNQESGESVWEKEFEEGSIEKISVYNSTLIVGKDGILQFIDPETGDTQDTIDVREDGFHDFTQIENRIYTVGRSIKSFNLDSLEEEWSADRERQAKTLVETDENTLYVGNREGYLTAHSLTDGDTLWETQAAHNIDSRPTADNGIVWVVDSVGNLSGFDSSNGENVFTGMDLLKPGVSAQVAAIASTILVCVLYANDNVGKAYDVDALLETKE